MACRCKGLREVFGAGAPERCQDCQLAADVAALSADGFTSIPHGHRLAYQDCGVEIRSAGYLGGKTSFVPWWAARLVAAMLGHGMLGPVLKQCTQDPEFAAAVDSALRLGGKEAVISFAEVQGLRPLPPVT